MESLLDPGELLLGGGLADFLCEARIDERPLLYGTWHCRYPLSYLRLRRRTIMPSVRLLLRVLYPLVGTPHGEQG